MATDFWFYSHILFCSLVQCNWRKLQVKEIVVLIPVMLWGSVILMFLVFCLFVFCFFCCHAWGLMSPAGSSKGSARVIPNDPIIPTLILPLLPHPFLQRKLSEYKDQSIIILITLNQFHFFSVNCLLFYYLLCHHLAISYNKSFAL